MTDSPVVRRVLSRLSSAALQSLEEVVDTYRARLLEQVELDHPEGDITGIDLLRSVYAEPSVADGVRLAAELSNIDEAIAHREDQRRRAAIRGIILAGAAAASAAAAAVLPALFPASGAFNILIVAIALSSAAALGASAVLGNARAEQNVRAAREERRIVEHEGLTRQLPPSDRVETTHGTSAFGATAEFLEGWNQIERLLTLLAKYTVDNPQGRRLSFSTALKQVGYLNVLTDYEVQQVRELLTIRNDLVHGELPRNYNLDGTLPRVVQAIDTLDSAVNRARPAAMAERGKRFVEEFLDSDAARRPLPRREDRNN